jgi:hypothetical protein
MYCIEKKFLGTSHHLFITTNNVEHVKSIPDCVLRDDGTVNPGTVGSFARIIGSDVQMIPSPISQTLLECKIPIQSAGLSHLVRDSELAEMLAEHKQRVKNMLEVTGDYAPLYLKNIKTLNSCSRIKIEKQFEGLHADSAGYCPPVRYDTTGTKTGRMSVISGPNVLTLPKGFKKALSSRFPDGKIVEIDYSALEPRTALAIANSSLAHADDVYLEIGKKLGILSRDITKQVVISFLYGAGMNTISKLADMKQETLLPKLVELKHVVNYKQCLQKIKYEIQRDGWFRNHASRPILTDTTKDGTLFNNFCQSSAVDVALSGFCELLDKIKALNFQAVPLCFIHDAVILDVPMSEIETLQNISKKLPTYLGIEFPTKLTILNS